MVKVNHTRFGKRGDAAPEIILSCNTFYVYGTDWDAMTLVNTSMVENFEEVDFKELTTSAVTYRAIVVSWKDNPYYDVFTKCLER